MPIFMPAQLSKYLFHQDVSSWGSFGDSTDSWREIGNRRKYHQLGSALRPQVCEQIDQALLGGLMGDSQEGYKLVTMILVPHIHFHSELPINLEVCSLLSM